MQTTSGPYNWITWAYLPVSSIRVTIKWTGIAPCTTEPEPVSTGEKEKERIKKEETRNLYLRSHRQGLSPHISAREKTDSNHFESLRSRADCFKTSFLPSPPLHFSQWIKVSNGKERATLLCISRLSQCISRCAAFPFLEGGVPLSTTTNRKRPLMHVIHFLDRSEDMLLALFLLKWPLSSSLSRRKRLSRM